DVDKLNVQITDGGSQAMELVLTACCGPVGSEDCPVLAIDAAYTNYRSFAQRLRRRVVSFSRHLNENGEFGLPEFAKIEELIIKERPSALIVIPYDNPTGQLYSQEMFNKLAALCVKYDMWLISDEAYRELYYVDGVDKAVSVWSISEEDVPGITGKRLSIESTSKVWNACGLRVGALITDNSELHKRLVAENTVSLCTNVIGQWIFAAISELTLPELREWFCEQRDYYKPLMERFCTDMRESLPGVIVSSAQASLYEVVDLRNLVCEDFNADTFVVWCASEGYIEEDGQRVTLLTAPMSEFYSEKDLRKNYGRTQMRIAFVETPEIMSKVPALLAKLVVKYLQIHPELKKG
ncbi:aminotransferase class I/II-fold pyridoxal phosphate-dependent enzyme, partial [bacterium]|nr:aminotransferase class I/II-fold pyridoxal phosphate-dependent enzyme [bacterium]